jgi:hypothetical protein
MSTFHALFEVGVDVARGLHIAPLVTLAARLAAADTVDWRQLLSRVDWLHVAVAVVVVIEVARSLRASTPRAASVPVPGRVAAANPPRTPRRGRKRRRGRHRRSRRC